MYIIWSQDVFLSLKAEKRQGLSPFQRCANRCPCLSKFSKTKYLAKELAWHDQSVAQAMSAHTHLVRKSSEFKLCLPSLKRIFFRNVTFLFWIYHVFLFQTEFSHPWRSHWESVLNAIVVEASALVNFRGGCELGHTCSQRKPFPCLSARTSALSQEHVFMAQEMEGCDGASCRPRMTPALTAHIGSLAASRCFLQSWNMRCLQ